MEMHMKAREHQHRQAVDSIHQAEGMKQRTITHNAEHMMAVQQAMAMTEMHRQQMMAMEMQRNAMFQEQERMKMLEHEFQKAQLKEVENEVE